MPDFLLTFPNFSQYTLLLSYFQYCQHILDPDVPTTVLQSLLVDEQENGDLDLEKVSFNTQWWIWWSNRETEFFYTSVQIDQDQAELARANLSIIRKEAQSILDMVCAFLFSKSCYLYDCTKIRFHWWPADFIFHFINSTEIQAIKDATQASESGRIMALFVLDALICIDHEKFFLSQLQSRGFLRSCLMSISNVSHQVCYHEYKVAFLFSFSFICQHNNLFCLFSLYRITLIL